jgi:hypothetical protein
MNSTHANNTNHESGEMHSDLKSQSPSKNQKSTIGTIMVSASLIVAFTSFLSFGNSDILLISPQAAMANTTTFNGSAQGVEPAVAPHIVLAAKAAPEYHASNPPVLQGATNGTIGPQEERFSEGYIETCGTVRVNNLANLEALLQLMSNGIEILCIAWGGATLILGLRDMSSNVASGMPRACLGTLVVLCGLAAPGAINWMVSLCRDLCLFN